MSLRKTEIHPCLFIYRPDKTIDQAIKAAPIDSAGPDYSDRITYLNNQCEITLNQQSVKTGQPPIQTLHFSITEGHLLKASLGFEIPLPGWSPDHYLILPAAVYNANRFDVHKIEYPPLIEDPGRFSTEPEIMITDLPRLDKHTSPSFIHLTTGDMATPAVGIFDPHTRTGLWLILAQENRYGNFGVRVDENRERDFARITVTSPSVRVKRQAMCDQVLCGDQPAHFSTNDTVSIPFQLVTFDCESRIDLLERFLDLRDNINPRSLAETIPFGPAADIIEEKFNRENWIETKSFYAVGTWHDRLCELWQPGWVGGLMNTYAFLARGSELTRTRAIRNIDCILEKTVSGSGLLYGIGDGENFYSEGFFEPHPFHMHLIRKNADVLLFMVKQFDLLQKQNQHIPENWKKTVRGIAAAFETLWNTGGQFGQFVDIESGRILIGGSTCASTAPGGLALASQFFNKPKWLDIACKSAKQYYERDIQNGLTTGGPGEILQAPDSESAFGILDSFTILYEVTGDSCWLNAAKDAAALAATWTVSYDFAFPPDSLFAQMNIRSTGSVFANCQNKHSAPAICTLSGDSLLKLFRATGDIRYLQLLQDIAHNMTQYLSRSDRPIGPLPPGWINERVNLSDWEGLEMVGNVLNNSTWGETSLLLTAIELPGLYVQPDTGLFCTLDNITAKKLTHFENALTLELTNPTKFDAEIRILCETKDRMKKPLGMNAMMDQPTVSLPGGNSIEVTFTPDSVTPAQ